MPAWLLGLVAVLVLLLVAYGIFTGGSLQKVSLFDFLKIEMAPKPVAPALPSATFTPDFVLGTWQVEQSAGSVAAGTTLVYRPDGTVEGWSTSFVDNRGQREKWTGTWTVSKISPSEFNLTATINGEEHHAPFRIFDHDHIQNENENYVAVRLP